MTELAERLRKIRGYRQLSRQEVAREANGRVSSKTVGRIEQGKVKSPRPNTVRVLEEALGVPNGILVGERPLPVEMTTEPAEIGDTSPIGGKLRPESRLAFDLVRHHYGWDEQRLIALAPLMFVILTERCIAWQQQRVNDIEELLVQLDEQMASQITLALRQHGTLQPVSIDAPDRMLPEHFRRTLAEYLLALAADIPRGIALPIISDLPTGPQGRVCEDDLERITGGSHEARWALEYGDVRIGDIPDDLWADDAGCKRVKWLEGRLSPGVRAMIRVRALRPRTPIGPRSIANWSGSGSVDDAHDPQP